MIGTFLLLLKRDSSFFMITHRVITHPKTIEKRSIRHVAMVAKFLDVNENHNGSWSQPTVVLQIWGKRDKIDMYDFPVHDCTQEHGSPYFSSIVSCQGRLLKSKNFAPMETWRHTSLQISACARESGFVI